MLIPLVIAGVLTLVGIHFATPKKGQVRSGAATPPGMVWNVDHWERSRAAPPGYPGYPGYPQPGYPQPGYPQPGYPGYSQSGYPQPGYPQVPPPVGPYQQQLLAYLSQGASPPPAMFQAAWSEAVQAGDQVTAQQIQALAQQFQLPMLPPQVMGERPEQVVAGQSLDGADGDGGDGGPEGWGESIAATVTTHHHGQPAPAPTAPVAAVPNYPQGWDKFCQAMRTREPAFQNDNYLGAYEHNRRRLRQLGIPEADLQNADAQYKAFCRDMDNYRENCTSLMAEWTGKAIDVCGKVVSVTPSGLLGLLKAAGPRGAEGWLRNPGDREAFPTTTEMFNRSNGCF